MSRKHSAARGAVLLIRRCSLQPRLPLPTLFPREESFVAQFDRTWPDKMDKTSETNSTTYNYYFLRNGEGEFKIMYMSAADALLWKAAGWEVSCHNSNEEARVALAGWQKRGLAGVEIHFA